VDTITRDLNNVPYVGVKAPQFSWARLLGADPVLGVEMASTGEVGCLGDSKEEAFLKAMMAANLVLPRKNILIMGGDYKNEFLASARALAAMGYNLLATPGRFGSFVMLACVELIHQARCIARASPQLAHRLGVSPSSQRRGCHPLVHASTGRLPG
jgi:hypothetical protein